MITPMMQPLGIYPYLLLLSYSAFRIGSVGGPGNAFVTSQNFSEEDKEAIIKHIDELKYADKRDNSLIELSR
jgi:hypothetical protein